MISFLQNKHTEGTRRGRHDRASNIDLSMISAPEAVLGWYACKRPRPEIKNSGKARANIEFSSPCTLFTHRIRYDFITNNNNATAFFSLPRPDTTTTTWTFTSEIRDARLADLTDFPSLMENIAFETDCVMCPRLSTLCTAPTLHRGPLLQCQHPNFCGVPKSSLS